MRSRSKRTSITSWLDRQVPIPRTATLMVNTAPAIGASDRRTVWTQLTRAAHTETIRVVQYAHEILSHDSYPVSAPAPEHWASGPDGQDTAAYQWLEQYCPAEQPVVWLNGGGTYQKDEAPRQDILWVVTTPEPRPLPPFGSLVTIGDGQAPRRTPSAVSVVTTPDWEEALAMRDEAAAVKASQQCRRLGHRPCMAAMSGQTGLRVEVFRDQHGTPHYLARLSITSDNSAGTPTTH